MVKVKIDETTYDVMPIPPYLTPFLNYFAELGSKEPANVKEAEELATQMAQIVEKVLNVCVKPVPQPDHVTELYRCIEDMTQKRLRDIDAKFFPELKTLLWNSAAQPAGKGKANNASRLDKSETV